MPECVQAESWSRLESIHGSAVRALREAVATQSSALQHGHWQDWMRAIASLPKDEGEAYCLDEAVVRVGVSASLEPGEKEALRSSLMQLKPWRKGPFELFGLPLDTEWRSDLKWERLHGALENFEGARVLDVGSGNGYYGWRMLGAGAASVLSIDPTSLYYAQFLALRRYLHGLEHEMLPLGIEALPEEIDGFDYVFSMGLLYHRPEPLLHLFELQGRLRPGGTLILETLVVEGASGYALAPLGRYAKMRNISLLPAPGTIVGWLERVGFECVEIIDTARTTQQEQRATDWMDFESLPDFLSEDGLQTVEGYPPPTRSIFRARRPAV